MKKNQLFATLGLFLVSTSFALNSNAQAPYSLIEGTVWNDENRDGIIDPIVPPTAQTIANGTGIDYKQEVPIAGILVKLTNVAEDSIFATSITALDGTYSLENHIGLRDFVVSFDFPDAGFDYPDNGNTYNYTHTVSDATTITQNIGLSRIAGKMFASTMKTQTATDYTDNSTLNLDQYKYEAKVSMSAVATVWTSVSVHNPIISVTNTTPFTNYISNIGMGAFVTFDIPGAPPLLEYSSVYGLKTFTLDPLETRNWNNKHSGDFAFKNTKPANKSLYIGNGTVNIKVDAEATAILTGASNITFSTTTTVAAGAIVIYTFNETLLDTEILPVTLSAFNARANEKQSTTELNWTTSMELNNTGFDVERSQDGKTFSSIGFVTTKAENGMSSEALTYNFTDSRPQAGMNIYRLKQIDQDGKTAYSKLQEVKFSLLTEVSLYPNPARTSLNIEAPANSIVNIYDVMGRKVLENTVLAESKNHLDISTLPNGNYSVQIINGSDLTVKKLTIRK